MYQIGKITSTHGIKGEIKVFNTSDFNRFVKDSAFYVILDQEEIKLEIETVRAHKNIWIIKLKGYHNINEVLKFKGLTCYTKEQAPLKKDEFMYDMLIGKKAVTKDQQVIGIVQAMIEVPQGHILEIKGEKEKKILIPFVKEFVGPITEDEITIYPIEGLI